MKIITGYKGESHITPNEIQCENQGAFGTGSYVMNIGSKFAPTLISANELQIADGEGVMQGVHFRVDPGTYDTVTIENGSQGMNRKDLIVCRYTKDAGTGVEQTEWVVIKGTPTSGSATRPSPTAGDIRTGSTIADMSMFEVVLSGVNVTAVNALFSTIKTMSEMQTDISTNANAISTLNTKTNGTISTTGSPYLENPIGYTKVGNIASVRISTLKNLPAGSCDIATLPAGYRPYSMAVEQFVYTGVENMRITINLSGVINVYNYGSAISGSRNLRCYITFPVA